MVTCGPSRRDIGHSHDTPADRSGGDSFAYDQLAAAVELFTLEGADVRRAGWLHAQRFHRDQQTGQWLHGWRLAHLRSLAQFDGNARLPIHDRIFECADVRFYAQRVHCGYHIQVLRVLDSSKLELEWDKGFGGMHHE